MAMRNSMDPMLGVGSAPAPVASMDPLSGVNPIAGGHSAAPVMTPMAQAPPGAQDPAAAMQQLAYQNMMLQQQLQANQMMMMQSQGMPQQGMMPQGMPRQGLQHNMQNMTAPMKIIPDANPAGGYGGAGGPSSGFGFMSQGTGKSTDSFSFVKDAMRDSTKK